MTDETQERERGNVPGDRQSSNKIVLGVEGGSGKYLLTPIATAASGNLGLFVALNYQGLEAHLEMLDLLYDLIDSSSSVAKINLARAALNRPEIQRVIDNFRRLETIEALWGNVGGDYTFERGVITLSGASCNFGAPTHQEIETFRQSIEGYVNAAGMKVERLEVGR
jgi:hypothetical protein